MLLSKKVIFPFFLAISPIIELVAGVTTFPNQINVIYSFIVLIIGFVTCKITYSFVRSFSKWVLLPVFYITTFIIVSFYGVSFEYSVKYHVLYLPLGLINYSLWFMVGYFINERIYLKYLYLAASFYGIGSLILAYIVLVDPDQSRIISGLDLPMAMPAVVMFGDLFWGVVILLISLVSLKKVVVICTVAGFLFSFTIKKYTKTPGFTPLRKSISAHTSIQFSRVIKSYLFIVVIVLLVSIFYSYMFSTVARFLAGREDIIRERIALEFVRLLQVYFPYGTGYLTFGYLTSDIIPYTTYTASGEILNDGVSLHNTFMHYMLEGGLPIVIIIIFFYWYLAKVVRKLIAFKSSRSLGIILLTWILVSIIFGLFHQFHSTRYFFGVFAYAFGSYERYKQKNQAGISV